MKKIIAISMIFIFGTSFIATFFVQGEEYRSQLETTIVIDAGHGGIDPGSHTNGVLEKNINLAIAKKLASFLNRGNINVIMTRTNDTLYKNDRNKDIKQRVKIINQEKVDLAVSIHVNSFYQPRVSGGQAFYKPKCNKSKQLASYIQHKFKELQPNNHREICSAHYYLLKNSNVPTVIAEVGFITNPEEKEKLTTPKFQQQMAQSIGKGIINYLHNHSDKPPTDHTFALP